MRADNKLQDLADPEILRERLQAVAAGAPIGASLIFHYRGERHAAEVNGLGTGSPVQIGCIAKALTATLLGIAQLSGKLRLTDRVAEFIVLPMASEALREQLRQCRIHQLLTHTSGLDHSLLEALPRTPCGFIDRAALVTALDRGAVQAAPGRLYHYSSLGSWLAAAVLEVVWERRYGDLLRDLLLDTLEAAPDSSLEAREAPCPAVGSGLRLDCEALLRLGLLHLYGHARYPGLEQVLADMRRNHAHTLETWPRLAQRMTPAWIDFGGSFGQLGFGAASAAALRLLPDCQAVIAVTAGHQQMASVALATIFKEALEDFSKAGLPRMLTARERAALGFGVYLGCFGNSRYRLMVDAARNGCLRARVYPKNVEAGEGEAFVKRYFRPAADHTFLPLQPEPLVCPLLQYRQKMSDGRFNLIYTERYIFTREAITC